MTDGHTVDKEISVQIGIYLFSADSYHAIGQQRGWQVIPKSRE
jgi:hypothetical protein